MPLLDAVGMNCKKGATTENQGAGVKYMGQEVYVYDSACVMRLKITTPPWLKDKVLVYYALDNVLHIFRFSAYCIFSSVEMKSVTFHFI